MLNHETSAVIPPIVASRLLATLDIFQNIILYLWCKLSQNTPHLVNNEAPCPQGRASRKGNFIYIVPLDPAYKAGLAGHLPAIPLQPN
jgi:hypothetical protein